MKATAMRKKYELIRCNAAQVGGRTLYQICALRDLPGVKAGDLGGFIESETNLSHTGNALVFGNALVCDDAWVWGDVQVFSSALVCGNAWVSGNVLVNRTGS